MSGWSLCLSACLFHSLTARLINFKEPFHSAEEREVQHPSPETFIIKKIRHPSEDILLGRTMIRDVEALARAAQMQESERVSDSLVAAALRAEHEADIERTKKLAAALLRENELNIAEKIASLERLKLATSALDQAKREKRKHDEGAKRAEQRAVVEKAQIEVSKKRDQKKVLNAEAAQRNAEFDAEAARRKAEADAALKSKKKIAVEQKRLRDEAKLKATLTLKFEEKYTMKVRQETARLAVQRKRAEDEAVVKARLQIELGRKSVANELMEKAKLESQLKEMQQRVTESELNQAQREAEEIEREREMQATMKAAFDKLLILKAKLAASEAISSERTASPGVIGESLGDNEIPLG
jgi:hypothetical protein